MMHDEIQIIGLDLAVHIGVPEEERATLQTLQADVILEMPIRFEELQDDLSSTIDYDAVTRRMRKLASERPRKLIETLASEMAQCILTEFGAQRVHIELRKRILPGVDHVAVRLQRNR